jgi:hypothetical protein
VVYLEQYTNYNAFNFSSYVDKYHQLSIILDRHCPKPGVASCPTKDIQRNVDLVNALCEHPELTRGCRLRLLGSKISRLCFPLS